MVLVEMFLLYKSLNLLAKDSEAELSSDLSRFSQSTRSKEERKLFTRQDKTMLYLESYTVLCTSTFYPNNLKS